MRNIVLSVDTQLHQIHPRKSVEENCLPREAGARGPSATVLKIPRTYGMSPDHVDGSIKVPLLSVVIALTSSSSS